MWCQGKGGVGGGGSRGGGEEVVGRGDGCSRVTVQCVQWAARRNCLVCLRAKTVDTTTVTGHCQWGERWRGEGVRVCDMVTERGNNTNAAFRFRVVFSLLRPIASITFSFDAPNKWKTSMVIRAYEYVEMPEQLWKNCPFGGRGTDAQTVPGQSPSEPKRDKSRPSQLSWDRFTWDLVSSHVWSGLRIEVGVASVAELESCLFDSWFD